MAYLSSTSARITPENYSARVKSITVRVCVTNCTGILYITDILHTVVQYIYLDKFPCSECLIH